jgi:hypothetical protein
VLANQRHRSALAGHDERQGAPKQFADDYHDLTLAGLFLSLPTVGTVCLAVCRLYLATEISAVDFDRAGHLWFVGVVDLGAERFAQFVSEHVSRLVLAIEITAKL